MRLKVGKEVEGVLKGFQTLFIAGDVPYEEIVKYASKYACSQLYFGADNRSFVNWETVRKILNTAPSRYVTIETTTPVPSDLIYKVNLFIIIQVQETPMLQTVIDSVSMMAHKVQLKFDTNHKSYLALYEAFTVNNRSEIDSHKEVWHSRLVEKV